MGFNLSKIDAAKEKDIEITVPLSVNTFEEDANGQPINVDVKHIFHIPTTFMREKHQQMLVRVRGKNVKAQGTIEANIWLWKNCIVRVEGYDNLSAGDTWKNLFEDSSILRIHAENAINGLMNYIDATEGDITKK
jgi:hypothetical protein